MKKVMMGAAAAGIAMVSLTSIGNAADESGMMSICNTYAAKKLNLSTSDIADVKYEGQRTDGTHAVNGTTTSGQTFQCSFNKKGTKVKSWVAGPAPKGAAASAPAAGTPSKDEQACLAATSRETNNGDVTLLSMETSEANNTVYIGVGPQKAKWKCLVKNGKVAEVSSMGN